MASEHAIDILARVVYGEARGEGPQGMQAVANVVINRVHSGITWWGHDIESVCLKPFQFSCMLKSDPNYKLIMAVDDFVPVFRQCLELARQAALGQLDDLTNGATSYYAKSMPEPPKWAKGRKPCAVIGHHIFFKDTK